VAAVALALIALALWRFGPFRQHNGLDSVAVLPLVNASGDSELEYLSDGITDGIISTLSQRPKLRVMARSTVFTYKGKPVDPRRVGKELNVRTVFTGQLAQRGHLLLVSAELVNARDGTRLWGESYNRKLDDVVRVPNEIARKISDQLGPAVSADDERLLSKQYTDNAQAYRLYLKGRHYISRWGEDTYKEAIECFKRAIDIDPNYALAYSGLAEAYYQMSNLYLAPREAMPRSRAAAERALALDPMLADAHHSLATAKAFYEWEWADAAREFERTLELNPGYTPVNPMHGIFLMVTGKTDAAIAELARVRNLDPLSLSIANTSANPYYFAPVAARDMDRVIAEEHKIMAVDATYPPSHMLLGMAYAQKRMFDEAIASMERARRIDEGGYMLGPLGHVYAVSGRRSEALAILRKLEERASREHVPALSFAFVHLGLGNIDQAFEWLQQALDRRDEEVVYLAVDPRFDGVRSDPRFTRILRQMKLAR
jgi:serine/threonine-protein kinase